MVEPRKRSDAKFYKPGLAESMPVDVYNTEFVLGDMYPLSRTPVGRRITTTVANHVTRGQFQLDVTDDHDDHRLDPFFDEFWEALRHAIIQQRISGTAFLVRTHPLETADDLDIPFYHIPGEPVRWIVPETRHVAAHSMIRSPPVLEPINWSDDWCWWNHVIDKSRIEILQLHPDETRWHGIGILEPCRIALWALHNLEKGVLDRISAWALKLLIFKIDAMATRVTDKSHHQKLKDAMNEEDFYLLDSSDDIVQLGDTQGHGLELEQVCLDLISCATEIPSVMLKGAHAGAVTGSEVNLTSYGQMLSGVQAQLMPLIKKVLELDYGFDPAELGNIEWNVDFFQSEMTKLEIRKKQMEIERMEAERDLGRTYSSMLSEVPEDEDEGDDGGMEHPDGGQENAI